MAETERYIPDRPCIQWDMHLERGTYGKEDDT